MVAVCSRCPMGLSGAVSLMAWARHSRHIPGVGYASPFVVVESWLLLAWLCMGPMLSLASCEDWPWPQCMGCCAGLTPWGGIGPSRVWYLEKYFFSCAICRANWVVFWWGLKPASWCIGSGASWEELWCRSMSDSTCDRSWATSYELQSNPQIVAVSAGNWEHLGGVKLRIKDSLHWYGARGQGSKGSRHLEICFHLPASF